MIRSYSSSYTPSWQKRHKLLNAVVVGQQTLEVHVQTQGRQQLHQTRGVRSQDRLDYLVELEELLETDAAERGGGLFQLMDGDEQRMRNLAVELMRDLGRRIRQNIVLLHCTQGSVVFPLEESSQMIEMVGHERVEHVRIFQEQHTVLHQIVYELAKDNLFSHARHFLQADFHFTQWFHLGHGRPVALVGSQSLIGLFATQSLQNVEHILRQQIQLMPINVLLFAIFDQFVQIGAIPRVFLQNQMVDAHSQSVGVALQRVNVPLKRLQGHENRTAHPIRFLHLPFPLRKYPSEPKIPYFPHPILQKDVGRLDIPMQNPHLSQISTALPHLPDHLSPRQIPSPFRPLFQRAPLTELSNKVAVVVGVVQIHKTQDMWVVELLQNVHLVLQQPQLRSRGVSQGDGFDGETGAFLVVADPPVDPAAAT